MEKTMIRQKNKKGFWIGDYTLQEDEYILKNHITKTLVEMGTELNRRPQRLSDKLIKMGLNQKTGICEVCGNKFLKKRRDHVNCSRKCNEAKTNRSRGKKEYKRKFYRTNKNSLPTKFKNTDKNKLKKVTKGLIRELKTFHGTKVEYVNQPHIKQNDIDRLIKHFYPEDAEELAEERKSHSKPYKNGKNFEFKVRDDLFNKGFNVLRSYLSKGSFDLLAIKNKKIYLVECKSFKCYFLDMDRKNLLKESKELGAKPILAFRRSKNKEFYIQYVEVTNDTLNYVERF